jgi:hypothetical protein
MTDEPKFENMDRNPDEDVRSESVESNRSTENATSVEPRSVWPGPESVKYVLPPQKYKLKLVLLFMDFIVILAAIYISMIGDIISDVSNDSFSFVSNHMFAFYCILALTIAAVVVILVFKMTHSARTRFIRDNEVRQDPNIKVWLVGYDWGWPVLFVPTIVLMAVVGFVGLLLELIPGDPRFVQTTQTVMGGLVLVFSTLNAAVVIFKIRPVVLGLLIGGFFAALLIMLLHGPETLLGFFRGFRHLGIKIEPMGYILLAYIWSIFLRIIWLRSLFFYWVFVPNRLELQHGLSESNDAVDRDDLRMQIDTDDVILRWWNVGIITFYFPELDRLPITNVILGIRKKAGYANRIAAVKTMQD